MMPYMPELPASGGVGVTPSPAPAIQPAPTSAPGLTLTPKETRDWWARVELSRQRRKRESDKWKKLLEAYLPPDTAEADSINSNIHFRNVQSKKAQLFFQLPELQLSPLPALEAYIDPSAPPPMPGQPPAPFDAAGAVAAKRELLNKLLGRDYANVKKAAIDPALFDVLATSGIGATKICYQVDIQQVPQELPGPPTTMPGSILGLQDVPGPTTTQMQPVPVFERFRWYRFSTNKFLSPHDFHSTDFDEAAWLGMEFAIPLAEAVAAGYVKPDYVPTATRDDMILEAGSTKDPGNGSASLVKGVEIWLHTSAFDPKVAHSQAFRQLVLVEGNKDAPAVYRDSPYQTIGPDNKLTPDSMIGNPIHPLTIRGVSDSAWPPSDSAFTDPLVRQLNTWASQDIKIRDSNIPRGFHRASITAGVDKLAQMDTGQLVAISDEDMNLGAEKLFIPIPHLERADSDIRGQANIKQAVDETLGLNANSAGAVNSTKRSATEIATVAQNVSVRLQDERTASMEWFLAGVRKFDALVQRYGDAENLTPIVGQVDAQKILTWHSIGGRNAFDAKPDSQLSLDAAQDRDNFLKYQNFNAKNPFVDQEELTRIGALKFGLDPSRIVKKPAAPGPPPPKVGIQLAGQDFAGPAAAICVEIAQQGGFTISPDAAQQAQVAGAAIAAAKLITQKPETAHGGAADKVDQLSKRQGDMTGGMPGAVPQGAPPAQVPTGVQ